MTHLVAEKLAKLLKISIEQAEKSPHNYNMKY